MEWFENQKALLEFLGKNPNDRSLVQRMIKRGEVYKEDWMYYISKEVPIENKIHLAPEEKKSDLKVEVVDNKELEELKKKNEKLIEAYKGLAEKYNNLVVRCKEAEKKSDWDLCSHLIFFYNKFKEWKKFVDGKAFWQAEHNKAENWTQDTTEMMKPEVYERYKFTYWETEREECKIVEEIINQREKELSELPF